MNCSSKCQSKLASSLKNVSIVGDEELVDVIARERVFNLRLLRMRLDVVDEAKYERSEKEVIKRLTLNINPK